MELRRDFFIYLCLAIIILVAYPLVTHLEREQKQEISQQKEQLINNKSDT